ncbi:MAG: matrixin family metalloprotease [Halobacteriota archaeon]
MNEHQNLKVCVDRVIPASAHPVRAMMQQARISTALHGTGLKRPRELFHDIDPTKVIPPERMALLTVKKWPIGSELKCRFLSGSEAQQEKAIKMAKEWLNYANIKFSFADEADAQIRIAFKEGDGSWSAVGSDALDQSYFPKNEPTMNFGWLDETTEDIEWRRVVVHEFGHALGCIHEHQSPNESLKWDKEAVYKYFMGSPNYWDKETIDSNILEKYSPNGVSATLFDRKSIMLYMFPEQLFLDHKGTPNNTDLSSKDKAYISKMYPQ